MKKYFNILLIWSIIILSFQDIYSQEDTLKYRGIRFGIDLAEIGLSAIESNKNSFMAMIDYEFNQGHYATIEGGFANFSDSNGGLSYTIDGNFGLIGIDRNVYIRGRRVNDDIFYIGLRYGYSSFNQNLAIRLDFEDDGIFDTDITEEESLSTHWGELLVGAKTEVWFLQNVFIGLSLRLKRVISKSNSAFMAPTFIPGYGDVREGAKFDINWTLSYRIPLKRAKNTIPKKEKNEKIKKEVNKKMNKRKNKKKK